MTTDCKAIISGNTVEIYRYFDIPLEYGQSNPREVPAGPIVEFNGHNYRIFKDKDGALWERQLREKNIAQEDKDRYLQDSIRRAATKIRRLAQSNHGQYLESQNTPYQTKHLTLTLQDPNFTFLEQTNPFFTAFTRRINRELYGREDRKLRYLAVPERQERGTIHYHTLLFNMPYIDQRKLQDMWEQGLPEIKAEHGVKGIVYIAVRNNPKVVMYLTKYLVKNFSDPALEYKRKYFPSVNLLRPQTIYDSLQSNHLLHHLKGEFKTYESTFNTTRSGKVQYSSYTIPKNILTSLTGGINAVDLLQFPV